MRMSAEPMSATALQGRGVVSTNFYLSAPAFDCSGLGLPCSPLLSITCITRCLLLPLPTEAHSSTEVLLAHLIPSPPSSHYSQNSGNSVRVACGEGYSDPLGYIFLGQELCLGLLLCPRHGWTLNGAITDVQKHPLIGHTFLLPFGFSQGLPSQGSCSSLKQPREAEECRHCPTSQKTQQGRQTVPGQSGVVRGSHATDPR